MCVACLYTLFLQKEIAPLCRQTSSDMLSKGRRRKPACSGSGVECGSQMYRTEIALAAGKSTDKSLDPAAAAPNSVYHQPTMSCHFMQGVSQLSATSSISSPP